ncbi:MAG: sigma-70 family RNA polymerase sigma factor [Bacteroidia bacterium]
MWKFFRRKSSFSHLSDEELVAVYRENAANKEPVAVLYDRYAGTLFGFCQKYLKDEEASKDAVGDIFLKLFEDLLRFEVRTFKPWLIRIAFNSCMSRLAAGGKQTSLLTDDLASFDREEEIAEDLHLPGEDHLLQAISELKEEQRICIELFYLRKHSYVQIAESTGYELNKVKSYIQNGKRNLEISLKSNHGIKR